MNNTQKFLRSGMLGILLVFVSTAGAQTAPAEARAQALADARAGRWDAAEPVLATLAAAKPADADACALLARRRLQQKRAKEAVELLDLAVAAEPKRADLHSQLGIALGQRMGEVTFMQQAALSGKLRGAFEKSVALDPDHVDGYVGLARYYTNAPAIAGGSFEKADGFAREVEKRDEFLGKLERGQIAERGEKWTDAVAFYRRAVELQPAHARARFLLGRSLVRAGDKTAARAELQEALKLAPEMKAARDALAALDEPAVKTAAAP